MSFFSFSVCHSVSFSPTLPSSLQPACLPRSSMLYTSAAMEEALRWPFLTSSAVALTKLSLAESTFESVSVMVAGGGVCSCLSCETMGQWYSFVKLKACLVSLGRLIGKHSRVCEEENNGKGAGTVFEGSSMSLDQHTTGVQSRETREHSPCVWGKCGEGAIQQRVPGMRGTRRQRERLWLCSQLVM